MLCNGIWPSTRCRCRCRRQWCRCRCRFPIVEFVQTIVQEPVGLNRRRRRRRTRRWKRRTSHRVLPWPCRFYHCPFAHRQKWWCWNLPNSPWWGLAPPLERLVVVEWLGRRLRRRWIHDWCPKNWRWTRPAKIWHRFERTSNWRKFHGQFVAAHGRTLWCCCSWCHTGFGVAHRFG